MNSRRERTSPGHRRLSSAVPNSPQPSPTGAKDPEGAWPGARAAGTQEPPGQRASWVVTVLRRRQGARITRNLPGVLPLPSSLETQGFKLVFTSAGSFSCLNSGRAVLLRSVLFCRTAAPPGHACTFFFSYCLPSQTFSPKRWDMVPCAGEWDPVAYQF